MLFLDEIHRMSRPAEEMLYLAMEDFRVDVIVGKGPGATAIPLEIPPFTLVGATTRAGLLPGPLRDRFGFTAHLEFYETADLQRIVVRSARLLKVTVDEDGAHEIASRSRGTPRIANRLLRRVRDFAQVRADGVVTRPLARDALALFEVDEQGLDRLDLAVLDALCRRFGGGPVGLGTLAVAVGEERETVEEVAEPFLVRSGYLARHLAGPGRDAGGLGAPRHAGPTPNAPFPDQAPLFEATRVRHRSRAVRRHAMTCRQPAGAEPSATVTLALWPLLATAVLSCRRAWRSSRVDGSQLEAYLPLVLLVVVGYLLLIRPARRRAQAAAALQSALLAGDEVMLSSGLFGTVRRRCRTRWSTSSSRRASSSGCTGARSPRSSRTVPSPLDGDDDVPTQPASAGDDDAGEN